MIIPTLFLGLVSMFMGVCWWFTNGIQGTEWHRDPADVGLWWFTHKNGSEIEHAWHVFICFNELSWSSQQSRTGPKVCTVSASQNCKAQKWMAQFLCLLKAWTDYQIWAHWYRNSEAELFGTPPGIRFNGNPLDLGVTWPRDGRNSEMCHVNEQSRRTQRVAVRHIPSFNLT